MLVRVSSRFSDATRQYQCSQGSLDHLGGLFSLPVPKMSVGTYGERLVSTRVPRELRWPGPTSRLLTDHHARRSRCVRKIPRQTPPNPRASEKRVKQRAGGLHSEDAAARLAASRRVHGGHHRTRVNFIPRRSGCLPQVHQQTCIQQSTPAVNLAALDGMDPGLTAKFRDDFATAKHIIVIAGAGLSAASGAFKFVVLLGFSRTRQ